MTDKKLTTKQKCHIFGVIFSAIGLYLIVFNMSMAFVNVTPYTPPQYEELHADSGLVVENKSSGREIKANGIPLEIKNSNGNGIYSCWPYGSQTCMIGFTAKSLGGDIFNVEVDVKWYEFNGRKLIYEIKQDGKIIQLYKNRVIIYKNILHDISNNSKTSKRYFYYGVLLILFGVFLVVLSKS